jgi:hypothetical protein
MTTNTIARTLVSAAILGSLLLFSATASADVVIGPLEPQIDRNKQLEDTVVDVFGNVLGYGWALWFTNDTPEDFWRPDSIQQPSWWMPAHTPGEPYAAVPGGWPGTVVTFDNSCWMASGCNMLAYEMRGTGYTDNYLQCLQFGGASEAMGDPDPWDPAYDHSPNSGNKYTLDEGGFQDWRIRYDGFTPSGPIHTQLGANGAITKTWDLNPVAWCIEQLRNDHPVGLGVWWGSEFQPRLGYYTPEFGAHAFTLWGARVDDDVYPTSGSLVITDSDDGTAGQDTVHFAYDAASDEWKISDYKVRDITRDEVWVCYAVAMSGLPSPVQPATWTRIKATYR